MYTQTEKVNIEPKSYLPVFRVSQNDVGRTLKAHLVSDEGTIAIPAGATVTMAGIKPSGLGYTVTGTINGSDVTFETDATMTDEAGQIESEIRIVDGETLIGTTNVVLNIEPNPHPDDTTDGQCEPLVNEITALLNQITAQADRVEEYSSKVLNMTVTAHESQEPTVAKTEGEVVNLDFGLPRGEKGERGERGEQGEAGKDGKDGLDGKDGKDGKDGINGVTPDFSIGTVTTLEPNESASVTLTGTEEEPVLNFGIPRGVKGEQGDVSLSDLEKVMVTDTASGAIASFPDGSDLLPALSLVANIVPQQSGSGTPSPENIRPISGWTEVETSVCGKNFYPIGEWFRTYSASVNNKVVGDTSVFLKAGTYTLSFEYYVDGAPRVASFWRTYSEQITAVNTQKQLEYYSLSLNASATSWTQKSVAVSLTKDGWFAIDDGQLRGGVHYRNIQLELGTTATAYEPYQGRTITTTLPQTVYGGTLDLVTGVLTVDKAMVDLGTLNWSRYSASSELVGTHFIYATIGIGTNVNVEVNPICSNYVGAYRVTSNTAAWNKGNGTCSFLQTGDMRFYVRDDSLIDKTHAEFKQAMSGAQLVYELAQPQTYQLTPHQIQTLVGQNNVWADSGDCSIEYYADTKLYIDKKLGGN